VCLLVAGVYRAYYNIIIYYYDDDDGESMFGLNALLLFIDVSCMEKYLKLFGSMFVLRILIR